jgi:hypothetical protein
LVIVHPACTGVISEVVSDEPSLQKNYHPVTPGFSLLASSYIIRVLKDKKSLVFPGGEMPRTLAGCLKIINFLIVILSGAKNLGFSTGGDPGIGFG